MKFRDRLTIDVLIYAFPACFAFLTEILILGPMEIYAGNKGEMNFSYHSFVWAFLGFSILISGIVALLISIVEEKIAYVICDIISVVALMQYIQAMFLNFKLMNIDGSGMKWDEISKESNINLLIWILGFIVAFCIFSLIRKKLKFNISNYVCYALIFIQGVAYVMLLLTTNAHPEIGMYTYNGGMQFDLGKDENVLIYIIDSYGNDQVDDLLSQNVHYYDVLKDFTHYSNTDSVYYGTYPSIPHMLTGYKVPENDGGMNASWVSDAFNSEKCINFYKEIHEQGYKFYFFSEQQYPLDLIQTKFDNITVEASNLRHLVLWRTLLKMSMYRYVPYVMKPSFEVFSGEFLRMGEELSDNWIVPCKLNETYYPKLEEKGFRITDERKVISITHLFGMHTPYMTNSINEYVGEGNATEYETGEGVNLIFDTCFNQLRELGLYDESTIIILSDHGNGEQEDYTPVFFVKRKGEKHDKMLDNSAPISHDDFMATILDICESDNYMEYGRSVFDISEEENRERILHNKREENGVTEFKPEYTYTGDRYDLYEVMKQVDELENNK